MVTEALSLPRPSSMPLRSGLAAPSPPARAALLSESTSEICAHCGAPVAAALIAPNETRQFCCSGCRIVYRMLAEHALGDYYAQREQDPSAIAPALATGRDYAEFDDPAFLDLYAQRHGGECTLELLLEGVHCAACVWLVEKLPELVPGVASCRLDYARRLAYVSFADPTAASAPDTAPLASEHAPVSKSERRSLQPSAIARALDRLGYPPHPYREGERAALQRRESRDLLIRLAVAGACSANAMLFALALYGGAFRDAAYASYFRLASALVTLPSLTWSAQIFYRGALGAVRARRPHMDVPLSLGIVLGTLWGTVNVARSGGEIYFDSLSMLIFVLLAARYVQQRQQARAELSAGSAHALTPRTAQRIAADGSIETVPAESVSRGARVQVLAGEAFPVDGRVESGSSQVDLSWLTGESRPEHIRAGSTVFAGTTNLGSAVTVLAERSGSETRAARVWRDVERAAQRRAPIAELADRVSGYFLMGVLALAALAFVLWLPSGLGSAFETAIALLVVTCPCGLALATPLTVSSALAQAARAGWLIKGGAYLEALARPALIVFDKTGTLTSGQLSLLRWYGDETLAPALAAIESNSSHPIAGAIVRALKDTPAAIARDCGQRTGYGIEGWVDGKRIGAGSLRLATRPLPSWAENALVELARDGLSPVLVTADGEPRALLGFGDPLRPDAARTLAELRARGHRLALLSGDRQSVVDSLLRALERESGCSPLFEAARGDQSPEDKLAFVQQAQARGNVFMVGDGVNDAAALAAASVGIAVHGGAEASLNAAHVFATRPGVAAIAELLAGARRSLRVIHQNLAFSLVYNLLAAGLTLAGAIGPLWAALIMPASSLTVVSHSYRRRMFQSPS